MDAMTQRLDPTIWSRAGTPPYPQPAMRRLRVYAFDPQASADIDTASVNNSVIALPWEATYQQPLTPGPCGEYIEVIDHDPASGLFYEPVDLNDPLLLPQGGLPPSEGRPQFHQQMVYAVAMKTILAFERALGRHIFFAREIPRINAEGKSDPRSYEMVQRLRIYPHAIRQKNAYYSPTKTALLFGYFPPDEDSQIADRWVFTCLSQDIVAHETAHAMLHGIHRRSIQPSNLDTRAFHEGFADIVALLQHFTMEDVLRQQIAANRGDLRKRSILNSLAGQFGQALGRKGGALRVALDLVQLDGEIAAATTDAQRQALIRREWRDTKQAPPAAGDPPRAEHWDSLRQRTRLNEQSREPHARGGFLVAAVFDAFATIYERRTRDLMRLAGVQAMGVGQDLPPELVGRLAHEAVRAADHMLRMCVRALDYVPPVDMTFGEYLRAIITADRDLVADDPLSYRIAVAQAFRRRGIVPEGSLSMAPDNLVWEDPDPDDLPHMPEGQVFTGLLPNLSFTMDGMPRRPGETFREANARVVLVNQKKIHDWLAPSTPLDYQWARLFGVEMMAPDDPKRETPPLRSVRWKDDQPVIQVYSARVARRSGPDGQELSQLIIQLVQKRRAYFSTERQAEVDANGVADDAEEPDFWFRGGATLLIDLRDGRVRYSIRKKIDDDARLAKQRGFEMRLRFGMAGMDADDEPAVYDAPDVPAHAEPFALAHMEQS